jgi:hypothetical protein
VAVEHMVQGDNWSHWRIVGGFGGIVGVVSCRNLFLKGFSLFPCIVLASLDLASSYSSFFLIPLVFFNANISHMTIVVEVLGSSLFMVPYCDSLSSWLNTSKVFIIHDNMFHHAWIGELYNNIPWLFHFNVVAGEWVWVFSEEHDFYWAFDKV